MKSQRIIAIEPAAPAKPTVGAPCNGCGICCLSEPCPLGMLLSRRRRGACVALRWQAPASAYRCGAVEHAPRGLVVLMRRWIGAGRGCDCSLEVERPAQSDRQSLHD